MIVPVLALIAVLFFVIRFIVGAAKEKNQGADLGDSRGVRQEQLRVCTLALQKRYRAGLKLKTSTRL